MKLAIIGSRDLTVKNPENFISDLSKVDMIISGGAKGIDTCAKKFALEKGIVIKELLPDYKKYGRAAPLVRNKQIVKLADEALVFWDGKSRGTLFVLNELKKSGKKYRLFIIKTR